MTSPANPAITIRPATLHDLEALQTILNQVIQEGSAFLDETPKNAAQTELMWLTPPVESFVACDSTSGEIVGAYLLRPNFPGRGSHIANATYMVKNNQQGRGIGRLLGLHSLQHARQRGYKAMQFNAVVSTNTSAVTLWQNLGFTRIGTIPNAFRLPTGHYVDLYIMYQPLS